MSQDRPTLTPAQLTVETATLVGDRAALGRLGVDGHVTIETARPPDLLRLLRNTVERRGYRLVTETVPASPTVDSGGDGFTGTLTAEAVREDAITLRERFLPNSVRLLGGLLAAVAGVIALVFVTVELAVVGLLLAGLVVASPRADARSPATVTYPVQLELSLAGDPLDVPTDQSLPTDSRFTGRPTPVAITVDITSYAPFDGVPESALRDDVYALLEALRGFSDA